MEHTGVRDLLAAFNDADKDGDNDEDVLKSTAARTLLEPRPSARDDHGSVKNMPRKAQDEILSVVAEDPHKTPRLMPHERIGYRK